MPSPSTLEQLLRESRDRLYPSLQNPNWLILRSRRQILEERLRQLPAGPTLCVLDVGGRLQPYRPLLTSRTKSYIAVDLQQTELVNVLGSAELLPFRDEQFDLVICTQVMEYLPEPGTAIAEILRVLRQGGHLFLSTPSVLLRNNEKEYWRFLPQALKYLLRNFESVEVIAEGNSLTGFFRTCNVFMAAFLRPRILAPVWQRSVVPLFNLMGLLFGRVGNNTDFSANYSVWARK